MMPIVHSLLLFLTAGSLRDRRRLPHVAMMAPRRHHCSQAWPARRCAYGLVPTYQTAPFGRVYAAYGGVFVVLSVAWGAAVEGIAPDRFDVLGAVLCLAGIAVMMYWPR